MPAPENPPPLAVEPELDALTPDQLAQLITEVAPDVFYQRAAAFEQAGTRLQDVLERIRHQLNVVQESWTGNGASEFDALARALVGKLGDVVDAMENPAYSTIMNSTGDVLAAHQRRLADLQGQKAQQDSAPGAPPPAPDAEQAHTESVKQILLDLRVAYWDVGNLLNPVPGQDPAIRTTADRTGPIGSPPPDTGRSVVDRIADGPAPVVLRPYNSVPLSVVGYHHPIIGRDGRIHGDPSGAHPGGGNSLDRYGQPLSTLSPGEHTRDVGPETDRSPDPHVGRRACAPQPMVLGRPPVPGVTAKPLESKKKARSDKPGLRTTSAEPDSRPALEPAPRIEHHAVAGPVAPSKSLTVSAFTTPNGLSSHSVAGPVNPADRGMSMPGNAAPGGLAGIKTPGEPVPGSATPGHPLSGAAAPQPGGTPMSPMMLGGMAGQGMTQDGRMAAMPIEPRPDAFPLSGAAGAALGRRMPAKETEEARAAAQVKLTEKFAELDRLLERGK